VIIDPDALSLFLLGAAIVGGVGLLLRRLGQIGEQLDNHGRKLVRIETKLNINDWDNHGGAL